MPVISIYIAPETSLTSITCELECRNLTLLRYLNLILHRFIPITDILEFGRAEISVYFMRIFFENFPRKNNGTVTPWNFFEWGGSVYVTELINQAIILTSADVGSL